MREPVTQKRIKELTEKCAVGIAHGVARLLAGKSHRPSNRSYVCVAPLCPATSKGPRFHYTCAFHSRSPASVIKKWNEARRKERAAAKAQDRRAA